MALNETNNRSHGATPSHPAEPTLPHDFTLDRVLGSREEELLEDIPAQLDEQAPALKKQAQIGLDENSIAKQVTRYLAQERREKLDQQIEALYERLVHESSNSWKETGTALIQLRKAHDIALEDRRAYDEALYLIAGVKERLIYKHTLRRWSQTWGLFIFFYALIWLLLLAAAFFIDIEALLGPLPARYQYLTTAWYAALAGGIGGSIAILHGFSKVISRNEFDRQDVMRYLVQPLSGFIVGSVMFFLVSSGLLLVSNPFGGPTEPITFSQFILILLGGLAGFGQEIVYERAEEIIIRFSKNKSRAVSAQPPPPENE
jgi:uncharacterized membrane protein